MHIVRPVAITLAVAWFHLCGPFLGTRTFSASRRHAHDQSINDVCTVAPRSSSRQSILTVNLRYCLFVRTSIHYLHLTTIPAPSAALFALHNRKFAAQRIEFSRLLARMSSRCCSERLSYSYSFPCFHFSRLLRFPTATSLSLVPLQTGV